MGWQLEIRKDQNITKIIVREKSQPELKKLQDVQQEREGTCLNYFKVFFNHIKPFSQSILLYLALSRFI